MRPFRRMWSFPLTVRRLVLLWVVSVLLAWTTLAVGWFVAWEELADISHQAILDVKALDLVRDLELAVLASRRAELLWLTTGQAEYRERRDAEQITAEQVAANLDPYITSRQEGDLLTDIRGRLRTLREQYRLARPVLPNLGMASQATDELLESLNRFHEQNRDQMEESVQAAMHTYRLVSWWVLVFLLGTAVLLFGGSMIVIRRMVRPALALTDAAAAFGQGQLTARAPVLHNDEMGKLAETFNSMADDISNRDRNRLDFVAMVVHDLKNPVMGVEMASRMLRGHPKEEDEGGSYLDAIDAEAKRLRAIVQDLTDDVQVTSGRFSLRKTPVDICGLTRRLMEVEARAFADHKLLVESEDCCMVLGDPRRIERVIVNLVSNAVKYSPPGSEVAVRVHTQGSFATMSVSDQGPGISREDLDVIFLPFGRGRSATGGIEGAGLGLYVVKQIVEAHGGRIEVESEPGRGCVFRVRLPLAPERVGQDREPK